VLEPIQDPIPELEQRYLNDKNSYNSLQERNKRLVSERSRLGTYSSHSSDENETLKKIKLTKDNKATPSTSSYENHKKRNDSNYSSGDRRRASHYSQLNSSEKKMNHFT
jgi:hypothetical protein